MPGVPPPRFFLGFRFLGLSLSPFSLSFFFLSFFFFLSYSITGRCDAMSGEEGRGGESTFLSFFLFFPSPSLAGVSPAAEATVEVDEGSLDEEEVDDVDDGGVSDAMGSAGGWL